MVEYTTLVFTGGFRCFLFEIRQQALLSCVPPLYAFPALSGMPGCQTGTDGRNRAKYY